MPGIETILVDIDGPVCNFLKQYSYYYNIDTGIYVDPSNISSYNLKLSMPTTPKYKYLYDKDFYKDIEFIPNAIDSINILKDKYNIIFTTSCVTKESMFGKYNLIERTFPWFDVVKNWIVIPRKQYLNYPNSVIVDDNPHMFLDGCQTRHKIVFALKHNSHLEPKLYDLRTDDWNEIVNFIEKVVLTSESSSSLLLKHITKGSF